MISRSAKYISVLGLVVIVVSLVATWTGKNTYHAYITTVGAECGSTSSPGGGDLIVDERTGEQLSCGYGYGPSLLPPSSDFLPGDEDQILQLAKRLAASHSGLSGDDKKQVNDLVEEIAPGHGDNRDILALADTGFIVGLIMFFGGPVVLGVIAEEFRSK